MFYNYNYGDLGTDLMGHRVGGGSGGLYGNTLPGAAPNAYNPAYGGIPQEPNPTATAGQAIQGNIGNTSSLEQLMHLISQLGVSSAGQVNRLNLGQAGDLNTLNQGIAAQNEARNQAHATWLSGFNQQQAQRNSAAALLQARAIDQQNQEMIQAEMERHIPGYAGVIGQRSHNISDELAGNVSDSTWNQLAQRAAERGAAMGTGVDSPGRNAALLAALGHTSEEQQARGASELGSAISGVPHAPLANVPIENAPYANAPYENAPYANPPYAQAQQLDLSNFLVGPQAQQAAQQQANWNNAMPQPGAAANANMNAFNRAYGQGQAGTSPGMAAPHTGLYSGLHVPGAGAQVPYGPASHNQGSSWQWDANVGAYVNRVTGQIADQPGGGNGSLWDGFSQQGINSPATEPSQGLSDAEWQELFGQYGYGDNYGDSNSNIGDLTGDWWE